MWLNGVIEKEKKEEKKNKTEKHDSARQTSPGTLQARSAGKGFLRGEYDNDNNNGSEWSQHSMINCKTHGSG